MRGVVQGYKLAVSGVLGDLGGGGEIIPSKKTNHLAIPAIRRLYSFDNFTKSK